VLGPLPRLYRLLVTVVAIAVFAATGAWAAYVLPYPFLLSAGAGVGLAIGGLCTFVLLHQFHSARSPQTSPLRRTRRY
jgi:hypothetical protein